MGYLRFFILLFGILSCCWGLVNLLLCGISKMTGEDFSLNSHFEENKKELKIVMFFLSPSFCFIVLILFCGLAIQCCRFKIHEWVYGEDKEDKNEKSFSKN